MQVKHVSMDYILHDIIIMTHLNLRPGKKEKDDIRKKILNKYDINVECEIKKIEQQLEKFDISHKFESTGNDKDINSEASLYWYPVNNVTTMKIQKVLPFICPPEIIRAFPNKPDLWNDVERYKTSEYQLFDITSKTVKPSGDALGDQCEWRYSSKCFDINTPKGRDLIVSACKSLHNYINFIIKQIKCSKPKSWIPLIGKMVYSYQPQDDRFENNPLLLVHLIKMMCDGLEYNVPDESIQTEVALFVGAIKELEVECYKWMMRKA